MIKNQKMDDTMKKTEEEAEAKKKEARARYRSKPLSELSDNGTVDRNSIVIHIVEPYAEIEKYFEGDCRDLQLIEDVILGIAGYNNAPFDLDRINEAVTVYGNIEEYNAVNNTSYKKAEDIPEEDGEKKYIIVFIPEADCDNEEELKNREIAIGVLE